MDNLTARTLLNSEEEKLPPQNISGLSNITRLRAGSHYRQFCRKLFTLGTKICRRISFRMRTHICDFSKIPKSGKKHQRYRCAWMGLTYCSKYRKTEGARRQSCQQLKGMTPSIDGKVTKVEESAKFHHSH